MTEIIYKYPLEPFETMLSLPSGAEVLRFDFQDGQPFLWVKINKKHKHTTRFFRLYGTGQKIDSQQGLHIEYINTAFQGAYVWHLFEEVADKN